MALAAWAAGLGLVGYGGLINEDGAWAVATLVLSGVTFGVVGVLLLLRFPILMGWLFLGMQAFSGVALIEPTSEPLILLTTAILLTFPSGGLPSRRWRWTMWALGLALVGWMVSYALHARDNGLVWASFTLLWTSLSLAGAIRIITDYRRSKGETRAQLKWLAWVLILGGLTLMLSVFPVQYLGEAHNLAGVILLVGSPLAIGIAVTRYRLYEIDRLISRTLSYSLIVGFLAVVFSLGAVGLPTLLGVDQPLFVAGSTLAVAAMFSPLRRRVHSWVDRRFNRSRYDTELVMDRFSASLHNQIQGDELIEDWIDVVIKTMRPRAISVWMRHS